MEINKKRIYYIISFFIFLCFFGTRLWLITIIPSGLHADEAGMAYDAWSLSQYGVDRHLKSWPVYFQNFGDGQSVMYGYLCAGLFKLFGYHVLLIRIPAVFFSFLTLVFGMLLVRRLYPQRTYLVLITGILLTICPYFILASRFGLDCNLMLGMSTVFLYCFCCAMESEGYCWYILAGFTGGLVLYTYALSYVALPLFLVFSFFYILRVKCFSLLKWISMAIPMGGLAIPLLLEQYINAFDLEEIKLGIFTITKMDTYRASEFGFFRWTYFWRALESIFLGDRIEDGMTYNTVPGFPNFYFITIPLIIIGLLHMIYTLVKSLKEKEHCAMLYLLFWFFSIVLMGSCIPVGTNRINGIYFTVIFLAVDGICLLIKMEKRIKKIAILSLTILYCASFVRFSTYYYNHEGYIADYYPLSYFDITVSEAIEFLKENPQYTNKGVYMAETPIYLALSMKLSPYDMVSFEESNDLFDYFHCNQLPGIQEGYNYIVENTFVDYANTLRELGYAEIKYPLYSLFYWKNE